MNEIVVRNISLPKAYHQSLVMLNCFGEKTNCPDWNTTQKELSMTLIIEEPLREPMISKCFIGGFKELEQYRQEMLDGILDFEVERGNWAYTYHSRYAPQYKFIVEELKRNPDSRRAVMDIRAPEDMGSEEPACLQHIQYFIRNNKLHCKVLFRSNDACKATFMNAFALIMLQKRIADELDVEVGSYTHRANSFHCYERDYDLLNGYCKRITSLSPDEVTYNYIGEWDEFMEASKPEIAAMVEELKHRNEVLNEEQ